MIDVNILFLVVSAVASYTYAEELFMGLHGGYYFGGCLVVFVLSYLAMTFLTFLGGLIVIIGLYQIIDNYIIHH